MGKHKKIARNVIQEHHLEYQKGKFEDKTGETVFLWKGEHWAITQLQRRKRISKGFIRALRYWINEVEHTAVEVYKKPREALD